jgi:hypothetical protein
LLDRFFKSHRKAMFDLLDRIVLESTSSDASVLAAVEFIRANRKLTREYVLDTAPGRRPAWPPPGGRCSESRGPSCGWAIATETAMKYVYTAHPEPRSTLPR